MVDMPTFGRDERKIISIVIAVIALIGLVMTIEVVAKEIMMVPDTYYQQTTIGQWTYTTSSYSVVPWSWADVEQVIEYGVVATVLSLAAIAVWPASYIRNLERGVNCYVCGLPISYHYDGRSRICLMVLSKDMNNAMSDLGIDKRDRLRG